MRLFVSGLVELIARVLGSGSEVWICVLEIFEVQLTVHEVDVEAMAVSLLLWVLSKCFV